MVIYATSRLTAFFLLSIVSSTFADNDQEETDIAIGGNVESQREFYLEQLSFLENASPALTKPLTIQFLNRLQNTCKKLNRVDPPSPGYCPYFYDSFSCWRPAVVGNWSTKTCPKYILGMHTPGVTIAIACKNTTSPNWDYISTNEKHFLELYGYCFESPRSAVEDASSSNAVRTECASFAKSKNLPIVFVALVFAFYQS